MKPFTLEWWLERLGEAIEQKMDEFSDYPEGDPRRYYLLQLFIERRIVRKYGERPE